ncbi:anthranilate synthase component II, partial [Salmonella enterica subsp. enterica serovar Haifa]|nr:anthranilate synthase component II [Salmonella enterica subsp. enterica serovar Haifa]
MTSVLVVDNHDSFVHTLVGYLHELGAATTLVESDAVDAGRIVELLSVHDALLLSPGPGSP